jgi:phosphate transport system substrate-binding protein
MEMNLTRKQKRCHLVAIAIVLGLGLGLSGNAAAEHSVIGGRPAVDSAMGAYVAKDKVAGAIVIAGSETIQPIIAKIASAFRQWQPDIKIAVQGGGSNMPLLRFLQDQPTSRRGDGDPKGHLVAGSIALLASSRSLTDGERADFRSRYGFEVTEIPIALDAVAVYVNRQNPVEGITMDQLDAMFGRDRKRGFPEEITTWGQLGLKGEWAQQPIHRYGRDQRSGTRTFFVQEALLGGELRADIREELGAASEILALSRDVFGIGYASIEYQASTVRVLPLAKKAGQLFVAPTAESVAHGTYPLSRRLYLYAKIDPTAEPEPEVLEFLRFVNSRQGQDMVVKAGVYPLPARSVAKNLEALTGRAVAATPVASPVN